MSIHHGKLNDLPARLGNSTIDLFICSASFEDRCLSVASNISMSTIRHVVVAVNAAYPLLVSRNEERLKGLFSSKTIISTLTVNSNDPIASADSIALVVAAALVTRVRRILIDITTLTREALLILVGYLRFTLGEDVIVEFAYAHAKDYSIGDLKEHKWLSKGIREVRSVVGFPGDLLPSRRNHLVILVGFEDERALSLARECEPSLISVGLGDAREEGTEPHQATNLHRMRRLCSMLGCVNEFTFQAYDAEKTKDALRKLVNAWPEFNTIIAPMNTKISTLGAALLALEDPAIQLCYAQPNLYNYARYSEPDDDYYYFSLQGFPK